MKATMAALGMIGLVGCVDETGEDTLRIEPSQVSVTVVDGFPQTQAFRATVVGADGIERDVTAMTTFALADADVGSWTGDTVAVDGAVVGPTRVIASYGTARAEAELTVFGRMILPEIGIASAPAQFASASVDPSCSPQLTYPLAGSVLPQNHGELAIHWTDSRDDVFEVSVATTYFRVLGYTTHPESMTLPAAMWSRLAGQHDAITMQVNGLVQSSPTVMCSSTKQRIQVTDQPLVGKLSYWSPTGLWRHTGDALDADPSPMVIYSVPAITISPQPTPELTSCVGCAFTRDGSRVAIPMQSAAAIYDFTTQQLVGQTDGDQPRTWEFGTFNLAGDKLVTAEGGTLSLITDTGSQISTLPSSSTVEATDPQLSPDGQWLANVESTGNSPTAGSSIIVRHFDDATNSFGTPTTVVGLTPGMSNFYLSWSPDGQWLAFTSATGWGTANVTAAIWVVKTDGSLPAIQMTRNSSYFDIAARWAPDQYTVASNGRRLFYLTYTSQQNLISNNLQLWTAAFYPDLAIAGAAATGPAFHMPFQDVATDNQVAQWTR